MIKGSRITLTNKEIKDIMKVINSLENRVTLLKETTRRITSQKKRISQFSWNINDNCFTINEK